MEIDDSAPSKTCLCFAFLFLCIILLFDSRFQIMDGVSVMPSMSLSTADVDLNADSESPLQVDISDALSEKDKVKFTVHTR